MDKQAFMAIKPQVKAVEVPEWGDTVYVKKFSAGDRINFLKNLMDGEESAAKNLIDMVNLLLVCICDENGKNVFEQSDYDILASVENEILSRLLDEALKFNSMGDEKEAIKNSETNPN